MNLMNNWTTAINNGDMVMLQNDIRKAFDVINFDILLKNFKYIDVKHPLTPAV